MFEICWWKCCSTAFSRGSWRGGPMMKNPPMRILFTPKGMPHSQPGTHWLCLIRWHIRQLSTYDFMDIFRCWVLNFLSSSPRIANLLVRCPKGVRQFKRFDSKEPMAWRVQAIKLKQEREQVETTWKHYRFISSPLHCRSSHPFPPKNIMPTSENGMPLRCCSAQGIRYDDLATMQIRRCLQQKFSEFPFWGPCPIQIITLQRQNDHRHHEPWDTLLLDAGMGGHVDEKVRFILIYLQDPDVSLYTLFAAEWHRQCHASQCNLSHWSIGSLEHSLASSRHRSPFLRKKSLTRSMDPHSRI